MLYIAFLAILPVSIYGCCADNVVQRIDVGSEGMDYTGGSSTVLLHGTGILLSVDLETKIAVVKMHDSGVYANQELVLILRDIRSLSLSNLTDATQVIR